MTDRSLNSFNTRKNLSISGKSFSYFSLPVLAETLNVDLRKLPFSLKILLENLLRHEDGDLVNADTIRTLANWTPDADPQEIFFMPARVLMQDFTGVPAVVDLAAMRDAMQSLGGNPDRINPLAPAELVIDHSVQVDAFGDNQAFSTNTEREYQRNHERYRFLKWGQNAFNNLTIVPPDTGIVHQINLEYLARTIFCDQENLLYPDTVVGTDSHTTMINGLGVLGWGVGGIEAEAAMLGQPISMLVPAVVGFELTGTLQEGVTATDLVLQIVETLRNHGVVGKFVEFHGSGLDCLTLADRATIANMAPEYGATCGLFPIDDKTIEFLTLTGRSDSNIAQVIEYTRVQGMFRDEQSSPPVFSESLTLNLDTVEPSIAGPKRPQDRIPLKDSKAAFNRDLKGYPASTQDHVQLGDSGENLEDGAVVIAAITSCTNTSNPSVMLAAGLVAKKARERGLHVKPWVKTSLAPGSQVVSTYLERANLTAPLNALGFNTVGYGCTTCIGNSGPLPEEVSRAIKTGNLNVCSVLSGNRNFEGRVHAEVRMNYLASPPLVVAYALAGTMNINLLTDMIGQDQQGQPVTLKDIWPTHEEIQQALSQTLTQQQFIDTYSHVLDGDRHWQQLEAPEGQLFEWDETSTYIQKPPFFSDLGSSDQGQPDIEGARVLVMLGDSVTTDHISPAGAIKPDSPAGLYLQSKGIAIEDFNSYGARRGNHEVMMRGTFANIRLKNLLLDGVEGGMTEYLPTGEQMSIYEASMKYRKASIPQIILAGKEYGTGSSRDWAAKGPRLLGVRAVIAESFERIHRTNLVGMGILPLQFMPGESAQSLGLDGREQYSIRGLSGLSPMQNIEVETVNSRGETLTFETRIRIDTSNELIYFHNGGILQTVLKQAL
ncbi:MAG: aconitate hydratase AcnA [Gammaproteobacteria bacterium]|nr:MAG: aconitate hydratase AcnA [Gammaproteobacteria bacterium]